MNPALPDKLLLISCAARMLAKSAVKAGIRPIVLDLFADQDTREYALHCEAVIPAEIGFDGASLLQAADRVAPAEQGFSLVYGSGMDVEPSLLEGLGRGRTVYGNSPDILRLLKTPETFFDLLEGLNIPYPEVRFNFPPDPESWLMKSGCSEGGKRVRFCAGNAVGEGDYFQRRISGTPMSALFLANGRDVQILGFNTLWTTKLHPDWPFLFAGAINRADLSEIQREQVYSYIRRLVPAISLKGLNSLDFMLDGPICTVLEINPRPSATMSLYDDDFAEGLLARHIEACRGRLDRPVAAGNTVRAFKVLFAPEDIDLADVIEDCADQESLKCPHPTPLPKGEGISYNLISAVIHINWPDGCTDRPMPGSHIAHGSPICTIEAEGNEPDEVIALLQKREIRLRTLLFGKQDRAA